MTASPIPTAPELPNRRNDEDANEFLIRAATAYRHGNVWATEFPKFAVVLLHQISGIESLRPEVRAEAIDILGRMSEATVLVSPIPVGHVPKHIMPEGLRCRIRTLLPNAGGTEKEFALAAG